MAEKHEKTPGLELFGQLFEEGSKLQAKWVAAGTESFEQTSELAKTSIKYVSDLSAEWRRVSMESTRKAMELFAR